LLKGETLFSRMGQKNIFYHLQEGDSESDDKDPHTEKYRKATENHINEMIKGNIAGIRYGYLFAAVILSQYLLIWSFKGPLGTGMVSSLFLNVMINLIVFPGVYNFLIGVLFLRKLVRGDIEDEDGETIQPEYRPYHPDQRGGYADIGKCALQINFIIILLGSYYVFRAY
jgi:hypothetical protein